MWISTFLATRMNSVVTYLSLSKPAELSMNSKMTTYSMNSVLHKSSLLVKA